MVWRMIAFRYFPMQNRRAEQVIAAPKGEIRLIT